MTTNPSADGGLMVEFRSAYDEYKFSFYVLTSPSTDGLGGRRKKISLNSIHYIYE